MEIKIQHETEQKLLHRKDYSVRIFSEGATPSRKKIADAIAKKIGGKTEMVIVRRIDPVFGESASLVEASLYESPEALAQYEHTFMAKRHVAPEKKEEGGA